MFPAFTASLSVLDSKLKVGAHCAVDFPETSLKPSWTFRQTAVDHSSQASMKRTMEREQLWRRYRAPPAPWLVIPAPPSSKSKTASYKVRCATDWHSLQPRPVSPLLLLLLPDSLGTQYRGLKPPPNTDLLHSDQWISSRKDFSTSDLRLQFKGIILKLLNLSVNVFSIYSRF